MEASGALKRRRKRLADYWTTDVQIYLIAFIVVILIFIAIRQAMPSDYDVDFISYQMKEGDTIVTAISKVNKDYNGPYNVLDLAQITIDENNLSSSVVYAGETYLIPLVKKSH
ncbi:hypothetical protein [Oceanobacillus profundus]|uniref:Uncharacterized protein n=1 Tax=Oceanobacillus profundus TaxID=372463 RepID=A0A417YGM0_9BACI|nr:hypothetical protein [Oceanobacillus profundus]RHW31935.1 hypothetical protein D1B32_11900 [Oceanobacillus profundus]